MGDVSVARIIISRAALALALSRAPRLDRLLVFWLGFSLSIERARRSNFIDRTAAVHRDRRSVHRYSMAGHANPTRHLGRLRVHAPPPTLTSVSREEKKRKPGPPPTPTPSPTATMACSCGSDCKCDAGSCGCAEKCDACGCSKCSCDSCKSSCSHGCDACNK